MRGLFSFLAIFAFVPAIYSAPCETVKSINLPNTAITLAQSTAPGAFTPQGGRGADAFKTLPSFCRVAATLTPVPDSEIKIEVWLPESGWNGKLESVGNGAWAGTISYEVVCNLGNRLPRVYRE